MILIRGIFLSLAFGMVSLHAVAADDYSNSNYKPNGNYASIGVGYVTSTAATPTCVGTDCYKTQYGPEVSLSLQLDALPNLVLSASGSTLSDTETSTTFTSSGTSYSMGLVGGFGPFDAGVSYSSLHSNIQICNNGNGTCASAEDTGTDFGAMLKLWLGSHFSIGTSIDRYFYSSSITTFTSTGYFVSLLPFQHHAFSFQYSSTVDQNNNPVSTGGGVSYSLLF